ncbi:hypothetical protein FQA39_LY18428 [Lamprigera yunnana]|nr:hypothetical protein FQA39_LY18428 [Lamprigera yunnana]
MEIMEETLIEDGSKCFIFTVVSGVDVDQTILDVLTAITEYTFRFNNTQIYSQFQQIFGPLNCWYVTKIGKLCAYFRVKEIRKTDQLKDNFIIFGIMQPNEYVAVLNSEKIKRNTDGLCQVAVMKMAAVNWMHSERAQNEQFTPTRI